MPRYGAVDIGSNSIRMQVAEAIPERPPHILAEDRQVTRLGEGVFRNGEFSPEATGQVCQFLSRAADTFREQQVVAVRAVATAAVRDANNRGEFLNQTTAALGSPVEVILGQEEARLIHLGVQSRWPHPTQTILIVDIGGGSAELILSRKGKIVQAFSKKLGAVRLTEVFLKHDPPSALELHQLDAFIREKLDPALERIGGQRPDRTIATSATAAAVACAIHRVPRSKRDLADQLRVSTPDLRRLLEDLAAKDLKKRRKVPGIGPRRAEVILPGCAVLTRIAQGFGLPALFYCRAGVRDGIIADLALRGVGTQLARLDRDQRRAVREMARRYRVSLRHADKVAALGHALFGSLQPCHGLPPQAGRLLEAAAYLHDIGHFVSDTRHHRHSYYVIANSDLPGFTDRERLLIANLCRYHRRALPASQHDNYKALDPHEKKVVRALIPLLRLADSLDRSHQQRVKDVQARVNGGAVELQLQSSDNTDLEEWAVQGIASVFQQVYGKSLMLAGKRGS